MKVVLTGSSGRIGRAIYNALPPNFEIVGIDRAPFATTSLLGDFADRALLDRALDGAGAVIHTAALHAPHVGILPDSEFHRINVEATARLAEQARANGVKRLIFTSTTALYGHTVRTGHCTWIDKDTQPEPETIYHRTKLAAEQLLESEASSQFAVRVIRMSRCFPEPADIMATFRLHRGVDARDVAEAHRLALENAGPAFARHVISGSTPFLKDDCEALAHDAIAVLEERAPELTLAFRQRGWKLPSTIDRVYVPDSAESTLGWKARHGFGEVMAQLERGSLEVLPVGARIEVGRE